MDLMSKSDLSYKDYSWTAYEDDDPRVSGEPDSTLLNRREGYEILYFINKMAFMHDLKTVALGQKIEKMIRDHVPSNIRSQDKIRVWIENNWKNY